MIHPYILTYLIALVIFVVGDLLWLGYIAPALYRSHIGHLMADTVKWKAAILFYLVFLLGLLIFVLIPSLEARSFVRAIVYGGFFGFVTYATYDLTNWAVLRGWGATITFIDILWGTLLVALVSGVTYLVVSTYVVPTP